jgi:hypothetical protein
MRYRGVEIVKVMWQDAIDIGKRESSPVRPIYKTGYAPVGVRYPMTMPECHECVDTLITGVMRCVGVSEREAIKLINQDQEALCTTHA